MVKEYNIYPSRNFQIKFNLEDIVKTSEKYQFILKGQIYGENGDWIKIGKYNVYCKNLRKLKELISIHIIKLLQDLLKWEE